MRGGAAGIVHLPGRCAPHSASRARPPSPNGGRLFCVKFPQYLLRLIVISSTRCYTNNSYPCIKSTRREVNRRARRTQSLPQPRPRCHQGQTGPNGGTAPAAAAPKTKAPQCKTPPQPYCAGAVSALPGGRAGCVRCDGAARRSPAARPRLTSARLPPHGRKTNWATTSTPAAGRSRRRC